MLKQVKSTDNQLQTFLIETVKTGTISSQHKAQLCWVPSLYLDHKGNRIFGWKISGNIGRPIIDLNLIMIYLAIKHQNRLFLFYRKWKNLRIITAIAPLTTFPTLCPKTMISLKRLGKEPSERSSKYLTRRLSPLKWWSSGKMGKKPSAFVWSLPFQSDFRTHI